MEFKHAGRQLWGNFTQNFWEILKCDLPRHMGRGGDCKESTKPEEHKYQQKACLETGWHGDQT